MIGAHPDDCDFCCGGLALKYARAGHKVKFLSLCNGDGGHQTMKPQEIRARRYKETREVAKLADIEYDVWSDISDCTLCADLKTRKRLVREIRKFNPDVIFCHRPNDYHADHRNASVLVQDAAYLLIVPNFCPDVAALTKSPVILYFYDRFQNPPFSADVVVSTDDVVDDKFKMLACHESQVFEWLPYTKGTFDSVPKTYAERIRWLREPCVPRDAALINPQMFDSTIGAISEYREARAAVMYRDLLIKRYGKAGGKVLFAEAFGISEYGAPYYDGIVPF